MASDIFGNLTNIAQDALKEVNIPKQSPVNVLENISKQNAREIDPETTKRAAYAANQLFLAQQQANADADWGNITPDEYIAKYGQQEYSKRMNNALQDAADIGLPDRSIPQIVGDTVNDVAQGGLSLLQLGAEIPAVAFDTLQNGVAGAVNAVTGEHTLDYGNLAQHVREPFEAANNYLQSLKSETAQKEANKVARRTQQAIADYDADIDARVANGELSESTAKAMKIANSLYEGAKSTVATPGQALSTGAQVFGSFGGYGLGVKLAAKGAQAALKAAGKGTAEAAKIAERVTSAPVVMGAMGPAQAEEYITGVVNNLTDQELTDNYPKYNEYLNKAKQEGMSDEDAKVYAREQFRNQIYASSIPAAIAIGAGVGAAESRFQVQTNNFGSVRKNIENIQAKGGNTSAKSEFTKEVLGEAGEEAGEALEPIIGAMQLDSDAFDAAEDLAKNVGESFAGTIPGVSAMTAPGAIRQGIKNTLAKYNAQDESTAFTEAIERAKDYTNKGEYLKPKEEPKAQPTDEGIITPEEMQEDIEQSSSQSTPSGSQTMNQEQETNQIDSQEVQAQEQQAQQQVQDQQYVLSKDEIHKRINESKKLNDTKKKEISDFTDNIDSKLKVPKDLATKYGVKENSNYFDSTLELINKVTDSKLTPMEKAKAAKKLMQFMDEAQAIGDNILDEISTGSSILEADVEKDIGQDITNYVLNSQTHFRDYNPELGAIYQSANEIVAKFLNQNKEEVNQSFSETSGSEDYEKNAKTLRKLAAETILNNPETVDNSILEKLHKYINEHGKEEFTEAQINGINALYENKDLFKQIEKSGAIIGKFDSDFRRGKNQVTAHEQDIVGKGSPFTYAELNIHNHLKQYANAIITNQARGTKKSISDAKQLYAQLANLLTAYNSKVGALIQSRLDYVGPTKDDPKGTNGGFTYQAYNPKTNTFYRRENVFNTPKYSKLVYDEYKLIYDVAKKLAPYGKSYNKFLGSQQKGVLATNPEIFKDALTQPNVSNEKLRDLYREAFVKTGRNHWHQSVRAYNRNKARDPNTPDIYSYEESVLQNPLSRSSVPTPKVANNSNISQKEKVAVGKAFDEKVIEEIFNSPDHKISEQRVREIAEEVGFDKVYTNPETMIKQKLKTIDKQECLKDKLTKLNTKKEVKYKPDFDVDENISIGSNTGTGSPNGQQDQNKENQEDQNQAPTEPKKKEVKPNLNNIFDSAFTKGLDNNSYSTSGSEEKGYTENYDVNLTVENAFSSLKDLSTRVVSSIRSITNKNIEYYDQVKNNIKNLDYPCKNQVDRRQHIPSAPKSAEKADEGLVKSVHEAISEIDRIMTTPIFNTKDNNLDLSLAINNRLNSLFTNDIEIKDSSDVGTILENARKDLANTTMSEARVTALNKLISSNPNTKSLFSCCKSYLRRYCEKIQKEKLSKTRYFTNDAGREKADNYFEFLFTSYKDDKGNVKTKINDALVDRLALAMTDSLNDMVNHQITEKLEDFADQLGVDSTTLLNAPEMDKVTKIKDKQGNDKIVNTLHLKSGAKLYDDAGTSLTVDQVFNTLRGNLEQYLGIRVQSSSNARFDKYERFVDGLTGAMFESLCLEDVKLPNGKTQTPLLSITPYNISLDGTKYINRVNVLDRLREGIQSTVTPYVNTFWLSNTLFENGKVTDFNNNICLAGSYKGRRPDQYISRSNKQKITTDFQKANKTTEEKPFFVVEDIAGLCVDVGSIDFFEGFMLPSISLDLNGDFELLKTDLMDESTKATLDGKLTTIKNSFINNLAQLNAVRSLANQLKVPIGAIERHFPVTSVTTARIQEKEGYGVIADKLTRELFRSTNETVDLTQLKNLLDLKRSVMQILGDKLPNSGDKLKQDTEDNKIVYKKGDIIKLSKRFDQFCKVVRASKLYEPICKYLDGIAENGAFDRSSSQNLIKLIQEATGETDIRKIGKMFADVINEFDPGADKTFGSLRALIHVAKYVHAIETKNLDLLTHWYSGDSIEVDGSCNGTTNGTVEYCIDLAGTLEDSDIYAYNTPLQILQRSGEYIGFSDPDLNMNTFRANKYIPDEKGKDNYEMEGIVAEQATNAEIATILKNDVNKLSIFVRNALASDIFSDKETEDLMRLNGKTVHEAVLERLENPRLFISNLEDTFGSLLKGNININPQTHKWEFTRSFMKKPATAGNYGSGGASITNKAISSLQEDFLNTRTKMNSLLVKLGKGAFFYSGKTNKKPMAAEEDVIKAFYAVKNNIPEADFNKIDFKTANDYVTKVATGFNKLCNYSILKYGFKNDIENTYESGTVIVKPSNDKKKNMFAEILHKGWTAFYEEGSLEHHKTFIENMRRFIGSPMEQGIIKGARSAVFEGMQTAISVSSTDVLLYNAALRETEAELFDGKIATKRNVDTVREQLSKHSNYYTNGHVAIYLKQEVVSLPGKGTKGTTRKSYKSAYLGDVLNRDFQIMGSKDEIGVSSVPDSVIGFGDASTTADFETRTRNKIEQNFLRSLFIYDGLETGLGKSEDASRAVNESVIQASTQNPLQVFADRQKLITDELNDKNSVIFKATNKILNRVKKAQKDNALISKDDFLFIYRLICNQMPIDLKVGLEKQRFKEYKEQDAINSFLCLSDKAMKSLFVDSKESPFNASKKRNPYVPMSADKAYAAYVEYFNVKNASEEDKAKESYKGKLDAAADKVVPFALNGKLTMGVFSEMTKYNATVAQYYADQAEASHKAIHRMGYVIDHMGGVSAPYVKQGESVVSTISESQEGFENQMEQIAKQYREIKEEEFAKLRHKSYEPSPSGIQDTLDWIKFLSNNQENNSPIMRLAQRSLYKDMRQNKPLPKLKFVKSDEIGTITNSIGSDKNGVFISSPEGDSILINDDRLQERATTNGKLDEKRLAELRDETVAHEIVHFKYNESITRTVEEVLTKAKLEDAQRHFLVRNHIKGLYIGYRTVLKYMDKMEQAFNGDPDIKQKIYNELSNILGSTNATFMINTFFGIDNAYNRELFEDFMSLLSSNLSPKESKKLRENIINNGAQELVSLLNEVSAYMLSESSDKLASIDLLISAEKDSSDISKLNRKFVKDVNKSFISMCKKFLAAIHKSFSNLMSFLTGSEFKVKDLIDITSKNNESWVNHVYLNIAMLEKASSRANAKANKKGRALGSLDHENLLKTVMSFSSSTSLDSGLDSVNDLADNLKNKFNLSDLHKKFIKTAQQRNNYANKQAYFIEKAAVDSVNLNNYVLNYAQQNGFNLSPKQGLIFQKLFPAVYTGFAINNAALITASKVIEDVIAKLEPIDLDPNFHNLNSNDQYMVQAKLDLLKGDFDQNFNQLNNMYVPYVICLALVDDNLREVLSKNKFSKIFEQQQGDNLVDKVAYFVSDKLSEANNTLMSTKSLNAAGRALFGKNTDALSGLMNVLSNLYSSDLTDRYKLDTLQEVLGIYDLTNKATDVLQSGFDAAIDRMKPAASMTVAGRKAKMRIRDIQNKQGNILYMTDKYHRITDNKLSEMIKDDIAHFMNNEPRLLGNYFVKSFMNDLMGRSSKTHALQSVIKKARSFSQRKRELARSIYPTEISKQFKNKHKKQFWRDLKSCVELTDLSCLVDDFDSLVPELANGSFGISLRNSKTTALQHVSDPAIKKRIIDSADDLANYLATHKYSGFMLRNAKAIMGYHTRLDNKVSFAVTDEDIKALDKYITYKALSMLPKEKIKFLYEAMSSEPEGMKFLLSMLDKQYKAHAEKAEGTNAEIGMFKGHLPKDNISNKHLKCVPKSDLDKYRELGYTEVAKSSLKPEYVYIYSWLPETNPFSQGGIQTVRQSFNGCSYTGISDLPHSQDGVIYGNAINKSSIARSLQTKKNLDEAYLPIFDRSYHIIGYEHVLNQNLINSKTDPQQDIRILAGIKAGRLEELEGAEAINNELFIECRNMYFNASAKEKGDFVNIFNLSSLPEKDPLRDDPIINDALNQISVRTKRKMVETFGTDYNNEPVFMVRRDMLTEIIGEREASITDLYTGQTRYSDRTVKNIKTAINIAFGPSAIFKINAYSGAKFIEMAAQNYTAFCRNAIVVKSGAVPLMNFLQNQVQLLARGVPVTMIIKETMNIVNQLEQYSRLENELTTLKAKLAGTTDPAQVHNLKQAIENKKRHISSLSIYELIEAGEFSSIADAGTLDESIDFFTGKWANKLEEIIESEVVPQAVVTTGKYALITQDTALYRFLHKSVQYGDFIGKAVYLRYLEEKRGWDHEDAMRAIADEFVDYDRLMGRNRAYIESIGMLWFMNYAIRMCKVTGDILRTNPVRAIFLLGGAMMGVESPMTDSLVGKIFFKHPTYLMGPQMMLDPSNLSLWFKMFL